MFLKSFKVLIVSLCIGLSNYAEAQSRTSTVAPHSFEVNTLWPFLPGGISEFRYLVPIAQLNSSFQGDLLVGLYSDFASQVVRDEKYGKVFVYGIKLGYRQQLSNGWHAEITTNVGHRKETDRPGAVDKNIEGIAIRLWTMVGYQWDFSRMFYVNARTGFGQHIHRSDSYESTEKKTVPAFDINIGVHF